MRDAMKNKFSKILSFILAAITTVTPLSSAIDNPSNEESQSNEFEDKKIERKKKRKIPLAAKLTALGVPLAVFMAIMFKNKRIAEKEDISADEIIEEDSDQIEVKAPEEINDSNFPEKLAEFRFKLGQKEIAEKFKADSTAGGFLLFLQEMEYIPERDNLSYWHCKVGDKILNPAEKLLTESEEKTIDIVRDTILRKPLPNDDVLKFNEFPFVEEERNFPRKIKIFVDRTEVTLDIRLDATFKDVFDCAAKQMPDLSGELKNSENDWQWGLLKTRKLQIPKEMIGVYQKGRRPKMEDYVVSWVGQPMMLGGLLLDTEAPFGLTSKNYREDCKQKRLDEMERRRQDKRKRLETDEANAKLKIKAAQESKIEEFLQKHEYYVRQEDGNIFHLNKGAFVQKHANCKIYQQKRESGYAYFEVDLKKDKVTVRSVVVLPEAISVRDVLKSNPPADESKRWEGFPFLHSSGVELEALHNWAEDGLSFEHNQPSDPKFKGEIEIELPEKTASFEEKVNFAKNFSKILAENPNRISPKTLLKICARAHEETNRPNVAEINGPCIIFGDLHSDLPVPSAIIKAWLENGAKENLLFNGDFADRSNGINTPQGVKVVSLIFALKALFPDKVFANRGNHEDINIATPYGFISEILSLYSDCFVASKKPKEDKIVKAIFSVFHRLSLASTISYAGKKIFVCHGGIFGNLSIQEINAAIHPTSLAQDNLWNPACVLTWADPQYSNGMGEKLGRGLTFGPDQAEKFLKLNGLDFIVRSHEEVSGWGIDHEGRTATVYSQTKGRDLGGVVIFGPDAPIYNSLMKTGKIKTKQNKTVNLGKAMLTPLVYNHDEIFELLDYFGITYREIK
jgi:serine/threonine-protein phosphatase 5